MIYTRRANCSLKGYVPSADLPCSVWTEFLKIWANILKCANFASKNPWVVCFFWKIKATGNTGLTLPHGNNWLGLKRGMGTSTHRMLLLHTHVCALTHMHVLLSRTEPLTLEVQGGCLNCTLFHVTTQPLHPNTPSPLATHFCHLISKSISSSLSNTWPAHLVLLLPFPRLYNIWIHWSTMFSGFPLHLGFLGTPLVFIRFSPDLFLLLRHGHWLLHATLSMETTAFILSPVLMTTAA